MKTSEMLQEGEIYTRRWLSTKFNIRDANLNNGIFKPKDHESVWLFLTVEKPDYMPQVQDRLEGDLLDFEGQPLGRTDRLIINHIEQGFEIILFLRKSKTEFPDSGFRFIGLFEYIFHESTKPTRFLLAKVNSAAPAVQSLKSSIEEIDELEGGQKPRLTSHYERNPRLRTLAINYHGTKCRVCGFDFEAIYGELGRGFIEVHHLVPMNTLVEPTQIDPKSEMITLCSNCHSMLHRSKTTVLSPDDLRNLLKQGLETP